MCVCVWWPYMKEKFNTLAEKNKIDNFTNIDKKDNFIGRLCEISDELL